MTNLVSLSCSFPHTLFLPNLRSLPFPHYLHFPFLSGLLFVTQPSPSFHLILLPPTFLMFSFMIFFFYWLLSLHLNLICLICYPSPFCAAFFPLPSSIILGPIAFPILPNLSLHVLSSPYVSHHSWNHDDIFGPVPLSLYLPCFWTHPCAIP